jgi:hypothetical protein
VYGRRDRGRSARIAGRRGKWWADRFASAEVAIGREACGVSGGREWEREVIEELVYA